MVFIPELPVSGQIISLIKPIGKEISFRMGEIIEGQVTDIFPAGGLTIKVKGGFLPVRTDLNFEKNETIFLKFLGPGRKNGEVVFQLVDKNIPLVVRDRGMSTAGMDRIDDPGRKSLELILKVISLAGDGKRGPDLQPGEIGKLRVTLGELLNSLPANLQSIPKGIRVQLQQVLETSLQQFIPDLKDRIFQIINRLQEEVQGSPLVESLKEILIPIKGLDSQNLKSALDNSGIYLEAKLRAMAKNKFAGEPGSTLEIPKLHKDLKAIIQQLIKSIQNNMDQDSPVVLFQRIMKQAIKLKETEPAQAQKFLGILDSLVKDVETFQLISKLSDSFHTFLPIIWDELKGGELIFKRRQQPKGTSFSCCIYLELKKLGQVSVFLFLQFGQFYATFKTDHPALKAIIRSHQEELREGFVREGLNLREITIQEKHDIPLDPWMPIESEETIISIRI